MCMSSLFISIVFPSLGVILGAELDTRFFLSLERLRHGARIVLPWSRWSHIGEDCEDPSVMVAQDAKNQPKIDLEHLKKTNRIRI